MTTVHDVKQFVSDNIAVLMHMANHAVFPQPFYGVKRKLCEAHGKRDGYDLQLIPEKKCWTCDGTGRYHNGVSAVMCRKCAGCGVYEQPIGVELERWRVGEYLFHNPVRSGGWDSIKKQNPLSNTIHGLIQKETKGEYDYVAKLLEAVYVSCIKYNIYDVLNAAGILAYGNIAQALLKEGNQKEVVRLIKEVREARLQNGEMIDTNGDDLPF